MSLTKFDISERTRSSPWLYWFQSYEVLLLQYIDLNISDKVGLASLLALMVVTNYQLLIIFIKFIMFIVKIRYFIFNSFKTLSFELIIRRIKFRIVMGILSFSECMPWWAQELVKPPALPGPPAKFIKKFITATLYIYII